MAEHERLRWDERYAKQGLTTLGSVEPPRLFAAFAEEFPATGDALDVACGQGAAAVWLACRGLQVWGLDISEVAIKQAREWAHHKGIADRCRFEVVDLDDGLPPGPAVDVLLCHKFWDRRLTRAMIERLAPGGLLAIAVLSEVGAVPGPFRAAPGELAARFAELDSVAGGEGQGHAWLLARANRSCLEPRPNGR